MYYGIFAGSKNVYFECLQAKQSRVLSRNDALSSIRNRLTLSTTEDIVHVLVTLPNLIYVISSLRVPKLVVLALWRCLSTRAFFCFCFACNNRFTTLTRNYIACCLLCSVWGNHCTPRYKANKNCARVQMSKCVNWAELFRQKFSQPFTYLKNSDAV